MNDDWQHALNRVLAAWDSISNEQRQALVDQVRRAVEDNDPEALSALEAPTESATNTLLDHMSDISDVGGREIVQEASEQDQDISPVTVGDSVLAPIAGAVAILLATGLATAVGREALRIWGPRSTPGGVAGEIDEFVRQMPDRALRDQLGGALTNARNKGRMATLLAAPLAVWYATERNDANACGPCRSIDDHKFETLEAAEAAYPNGGYIDCEGGVRCRGGVVPVWES